MNNYTNWAPLLMPQQRGPVNNNNTNNGNNGANGEEDGDFVMDFDLAFDEEGADAAARRAQQLHHHAATAAAVAPDMPLPPPLAHAADVDREDIGLRPDPRYPIYRYVAATDDEEDVLAQQGPPPSPPRTGRPDAVPAHPLPPLHLPHRARIDALMTEMTEIRGAIHDLRARLHTPPMPSAAGILAIQRELRRQQAVLFTLLRELDALRFQRGAGRMPWEGGGGGVLRRARPRAFPPPPQPLPRGRGPPRAGVIGVGFRTQPPSPRPSREPSLSSSERSQSPAQRSRQTTPRRRRQRQQLQGARSRHISPATRVRLATELRGQHQLLRQLAPFGDAQPELQAEIANLEDILGGGRRFEGAFGRGDHGNGNGNDDHGRGIDNGNNDGNGNGNANNAHDNINNPHDEKEEDLRFPLPGQPVDGPITLNDDQGPRYLVRLLTQDAAATEAIVARGRAALTRFEEGARWALVEVALAAGSLERVSAGPKGVIWAIEAGRDDVVGALGALSVAWSILGVGEGASTGMVFMLRSSGESDGESEGGE